MSQYLLHDPLLELHGKLSKKNGRVIYMVRSDTGKAYTAIRKQETEAQKQKRQENLTPAQQAQQEKFKKAAQAAKVRMKDSSQKDADLAAYTAQKKYPTLFGFLFADEYNKL